jgi:hypothetical protein
MPFSHVRNADIYTLAQVDRIESQEQKYAMPNWQTGEQTHLVVQRTGLCKRAVVLCLEP